MTELIFGLIIYHACDVVLFRIPRPMTLHCRAAELVKQAPAQWLCNLDELGALKRHQVMLDRRKRVALETE